MNECIMMLLVALEGKSEFYLKSSKLQEWQKQFAVDIRLRPLNRIPVSACTHAMNDELLKSIKLGYILFNLIVANVFDLVEINFIVHSFHPNA